MLAKFYLTAAAGSATLLLLGCGADPASQPVSSGTQASGEELRVTLHIPEMADRLELM